MQKNRIYPIMAGIFALGALIVSCSENEKMKLDGNLMQNKLQNQAISASSALSPIEELGKALFFDMNLSDPSGVQSCATCHAPEVGFTGPHSEINLHGAVYEGAFPGRFGDRKPPSAAYAGDSPVLYMGGDNIWVGGMFWDGRATGWTLGDPLAEQAKGPYLNPKEQNIASAQALIDLVKVADYADLFEEVFPGSLEGDVSEAYNNVGRAVAAYERSAEVNPFTSKYDYWLKGKAKLTAQEHLGKAMFQGKGKCSLCHLIKGKKPLFSRVEREGVIILLPCPLIEPYVQFSRIRLSYKLRHQHSQASKRVNTFSWIYQSILSNKYFKGILSIHPAFPLALAIIIPI